MSILTYEQASNRVADDNVSNRILRFLAHRGSAREDEIALFIELKVLCDLVERNEMNVTKQKNGEWVFQKVPSGVIGEG